MQRTALIVLIMDPGIVVVGLRLAGFGDRGDLRGIDVPILVQHINVDQRSDAPDLRDEEQAKTAMGRGAEADQTSFNVRAGSVSNQGLLIAILLASIEAKQVASQFVAMWPFRNGATR
jgi:hypothetical protein